MKIAISSEFVAKGRVGGAEQMLYNLLRGFRSLGTEIVLLSSDVESLDKTFLAEIAGTNITMAKARSPYGAKRFIREQLMTLRPSFEADAIIFPNYFTPPVVSRRLGQVVTVIHDLQYRRFPELTPAFRYRWLASTHHWTFKRADRVVVISEFVRREIAQFYGSRAARKCIVIPNPVCWERFSVPQDRAPPFDGAQYILAVAAHYPHKNLGVLIEALQIVRRTADVRLVLVGQLPGALMGIKSDAPDVRALIASLGLTSHVTVTGYIDDVSVGWYYQHACLFACPSLYEGFGLPAVEAMGFGLPTVTTRRGSLPEVTLGEATYIDEPKDAEEWAHAFKAVLAAPYRLPRAIQDRIRETYAPSRIGDMYLKQCAARAVA